MRIQAKMAVAVLLFGFLSSTVARADGGIVQNASKDAAKGAIKAAEQEINSNTGTIVQGTKQMSKGMIDGIANAVPLVTSQMVNQANVNRRAIGSVAKQVSSDAVVGAMATSIREMDAALGKRGDGPLADSLTATTERVTSGVVRGVTSEVHIDGATTEKLAAAAVRGAMSEMHFNFPIWSFILAFALGGICTFLCGLGLTMLYVLFQRRRETTVVTQHGAVHTRPAHGMA